MISDIKLWPQQGQGKIKARGSFLISNAFRVQFSVCEGPKGLFVGLPSRKGTDKEGKEKYYNDVFCTDKEVFAQMNKAVLDVYNNATGNVSSQGEASGPEDQSGGLPF